MGAEPRTVVAGMPQQGWRFRAVALTLAGLAGAAVMVVELGVARILTPVFGGSITVWALVIATTMLALAAGYAVGGRRADRRGGIPVASRAALAGALLCAALPWLRLPVIHVTIDLPTLTGAAVAAALLIAPPLFFFSQVSPALIRGLATGHPGHVGGTAGGVYAISTVGSLAGTLAALWAFLYAPLAAGFLGMALLLVLPVLALRPLAAGAATLAITGGGLLGLAGESGPVTATNEQGREVTLIAERHSAYGELRVIDEGGLYRYMVVNGADQGGIVLETGSSAYAFEDGLVGLAGLYVAKPASALVIGLGPGVIPMRLRDAGWEVDVVEIDPEVVRAARDYFGFRGQAAVDDGRRYLQRSGRRWDVIFVDAFLSGNPPWQLYTREAFELYARHLRPGGAVLLNFVGSHLDPAQRPALEAVVTTARAVFSTVDAYPDPWEPDDYPTRNIFIAAADHPRLAPLRAGDPRRATRLSEAIARSEPITVAGGRLLTDGSAPLGPLVRRTAEILRSRTGSYLPLAVRIE